MRISSTLAPIRITDVVAEAAMLEDAGCYRLWVGEGRLRRDAVTTLTLAATATSRIGLASGIIPARTRNVALTAITWKSLYELAPGRVALGLGAWWEPIASKCGLPTASPLTAIREHVEVLRALFRNDTVTFRGNYVDVDEIRFEDKASEFRTGYPIPIYLGAVGPKMLNLAAEVADGVLLDFFVPTEYTIAAAARLLGARADHRATAFGMPQLVACFTNPDPRHALETAKRVFVRYLAQQDHVARHSGADPELVARIRKLCTWPATKAELAAVAPLVPSSLVTRVCAVGTPAQVVERLQAYHAAGADELVLSPFAERPYEALRSVLDVLRSEGLLSGRR